MNVEKQDRDQRKWFRCKAAGPRQRCELKVGSRIFPAQLLDESAGGFSVLVNRLEGLSVGQTAQLAAEIGCFAVRVVYLAKVQPTKDDNLAAGTPGPWFRLGLHRLEELTLPSEPTISLLAGSLRSHLRSWCPSGGTLTAVGVLLLVVGVGVPIGLTGVNWFLGASNAKRSPQWTDRPSESSAQNMSSDGTTEKRSLRAPADESPFGGSQSSSQGRRSGFDDGGGPSSGFSSPSEQAPQYRPTQLPGAAALLTPEVVERLQLTADQQERIRQLIETTSRAMRNLDSHFQGQQRQQISRLRTQLLDEARRKALDLLTGRQRAEWEKLAGGQ